MATRILALAAAALLLAACDRGSTGALDGKWGTDCATPFVAFSGSTIHVYPDNADYKITSSVFGDNKYTVTYDAKTGPVTETYVYENDTLRLGHGFYGGTEATWHKQPMTRCP